MGFTSARLTAARIGIMLTRLTAAGIGFAPALATTGLCESVLMISAIRGSHVLAERSSRGVNGS